MIEKTWFSSISSVKDGTDSLRVDCDHNKARHLEGVWRRMTKKKSGRNIVEFGCEVTNLPVKKKQKHYETVRSRKKVLGKVIYLAMRWKASRNGPTVKTANEKYINKTKQGKFQQLAMPDEDLYPFRSASRFRSLVQMLSPKDRVAKRAWSTGRKRDIRGSRVDSTQHVDLVKEEINLKSHQK